MSIAWATPFDARISASMTVAVVPAALVMVTTPPALTMVRISPPTVGAWYVPSSPSETRYRPAITWRRRTAVRAGLSWRRASKSSAGILSKASLVGARTVNGPSMKKRKQFRKRLVEKTFKDFCKEIIK